MGSRVLTSLAGLVAGLALAAPAQGASGIWDRAWGEDVIQTGKPGDLGAVFEICTVAADCQAVPSSPPALGGELNAPNGVATDAIGNVYVADTNNHRIQKFDSSGNFLAAWGKDVDGVAVPTGFEVCTVAANCKTGVLGGLGGELNFPAGVATDSAGNVYVADQTNHRIQKFSSMGAWDRAWGNDVDVGGVLGFETCTVAGSCKAGTVSAPANGGEMNLPNGIATDSASNVYVADQSHHRIQKFSSTGAWDRAWGEDVDAVAAPTGFEICTVAADCKTGVTTAPALGGELNFPLGLATDASGNVYVADEVHHRVQKFSSTGVWERTWGMDVDGVAIATGFEICTTTADCKTGTAGGLGGEMNFPSGVAADPAGNVYALEIGGNRVQRFDAMGNWQRAWGKAVNGGGVFGICTVAASCLAGATGTLGGEMDFPLGIAADASGSLYVTEQTNNRVEKFADPPPPPPPPSGGATPSTPQPKQCKKGKRLKKGKCVKRKRKKKAARPPGP